MDYTYGVNYEAERLILIGMLELVCDQQLVCGVRPTFQTAIKCLHRFPLDTESPQAVVSLMHLAACLPDEAFEQTHTGTQRAIRMQHERLVTAILR